MQCSHASLTSCLRLRSFISSSCGPTSSVSQLECGGTPSRLRHASSTSRWVDRQTKDRFAREAKVQGLKSRAAFKLLQINDKYRLFKPGMTVVDLGFAPGSWSQVAVDMTKPSGRVLGVDLIPAQPPKGVSAMQGDFMSPDIQSDIKSFLRDPDRGRPHRKQLFATTEEEAVGAIRPDALEEVERGYIDIERRGSSDDTEDEESATRAEHDDKVVDVVLSDMWAPWEQIDGLYKRSLSNPYLRMMNTSGNNFRDHAGSMDLCRSALYFSYETLKVGGHFVCKFYQGAEDKLLEKSLKAMFQKVHREKPESSRKDSKEAFFVGIRRLAKSDRSVVFDAG